MLSGAPFGSESVTCLFRYGPGANLTTMADKTLGSSGKMVVTALYLFIYGATLCAYMAEGARFLDMGLAGTCVL